MRETVYCGERAEGNAMVWKKTVRDGEDVARQILPPRNDLRNHSPTGFEWGYGGSGPAQLALALVLDAIGDEHIALATYQSFKWEVVAQLPHEAWRLTQASIRDVVKATSVVTPSPVTPLNGIGD